MNVAVGPNSVARPRMLGAMIKPLRKLRPLVSALLSAVLLTSVAAISGCGPSVVTASGVQKAVTPSLAGHGVKMHFFKQVAPTGFEGRGTDSKGDACLIAIKVSGGMLNYQVKSDVRTSAGGTESATSSVVFGSMPYKE